MQPLIDAIAKIQAAYDTRLASIEAQLVEELHQLAIKANGGVAAHIEKARAEAQAREMIARAEASCLDQDGARDPRAATALAMLHAGCSYAEAADSTGLAPEAVIALWADRETSPAAA